MTLESKGIEKNGFNTLTRSFTVCAYCHETDWCAVRDNKELCEKCYFNTNKYSTTNVLYNLLCKLEEHGKSYSEYVMSKCIRNEIVRGRRKQNAEETN